MAHERIEINPKIMGGWVMGWTPPDGIYVPR